LIKNVDDVFYKGEAIVTFQLAPLFNTCTSDFTPSCHRAFKRIFRIADADRDGLLSDIELKVLQMKCFGNNDMNDSEVATIKRRIQKTIPNSIYQDMITYEGFVGFMRLFVERYQLQVNS